MRTKLSNILGVGLALVLVFGLAFALVPTKEAEAQLSTNPNQWLVQNLPGTTAQGTNNLRAADVGSLAVANDGMTMYAVDNQTAAILKSNNAGTTWVPLTNPGWVAGVAARLIAVSPDNPNAIAVVDNTTGTAASAAGQVWISNNGGTTWAAINMAGTGPGGGGGDEVRAIAVGPTRANCILGRDYAIAISDNATNSTGGGDIYFCGLNTTWVSCVAQGAFNPDTYDFTSVAFTPSFVGDRCLVAVGSDNAAVGLDETYLLVIQTADTGILATTLAPYPVQMVTATMINSPGDFDVAGVGVNAMIQSSIALPADFDPTSPPSGYRTWVSWTSVGNAAGDDVYRVDFTTVRQLQTGCATGIWDIAYSGVISGGTLIAGESASVDNSTVIVWATSDPQLSQPSWVGSAKSPTGAGNCIVAMASPDICYAGTSGIESAFSVSMNGGASFNQRSLINTSIDTIQDVYASPDGKTVFMATSDNCINASGTGSTSNRESLWKSATPVTFYGWERVRMSPTDWGDAVGDTIVRLSPEYLDDATVYWLNRNGTAIQRSVTGGDIFSNRTAPSNIGDMAVENGSIVYYSDNAAPNLYVSTSGAWGFDLPINTTLAPFGNLAMCPSYPEIPVPGNLIGGCVAAGIVGISLDAGVSWIPLLPPVPAGGAEQVVVHPDWANRKLVYAGDTTAGAGIYRYEFGVSNAWEQISATLAAGSGITGVAMAGGVLYASENVSADRQLYPTLGVGDMNNLLWDTMTVGGAGRLFNATPSALRAVVRDGEVNLWAIDTIGPLGAGALMAYDDTMALAEITPTLPATVAYDPNSGQNAQFAISWPQVSNATWYDLVFFMDPGCTQVAAAFFNTVTPVPAAPAMVVPTLTLPAGQDYYLLIRASNQVPADAIHSRYGAPTKFTVEIGVPIQAPGVGPVLTSPAPGATDVDAADVVFSWGTMLQATEYEFILATDSALTNTVAGTPAYVTTPSFGPVTLDYDSSYFYAVKVTQPSASPQSIGSFTTTAVPVEKYTCQYCGLTFDTRAELEAHIAAVHAPTTPLYIWIVIAIGAVLVIAVIWLIFTTRKA